MHTTAIADSGYRNLPLSMLDESSTNPRRTFEPAKLVELAHSLSIYGLIQPITVRLKGDRFEVAAGVRRFRAARIVELADVPTRILDLSDEQTLEVQTIENSQREKAISYPDAQPLCTLDSAYLSSQIGAQKPISTSFVGQPAYCSQPQIDRRRGVAPMAKITKRKSPKTTLRLPDLQPIQGRIECSRGYVTACTT